MDRQQPLDEYRELPRGPARALGFSSLWNRVCPQVHRPRPSAVCRSGKTVRVLALRCRGAQHRQGHGGTSKVPGQSTAGFDQGRVARTSSEAFRQRDLPIFDPSVPSSQCQQSAPAAARQTLTTRSKEHLPRIRVLRDTPNLLDQCSENALRSKFGHVGPPSSTDLAELCNLCASWCRL